MGCPLYGVSAIWGVRYMGYPLYGVSAIWGVRYMGCPLYGVSAIWGVRYMGCPLYGVSAIWGVRYMGCPLYGVSAIERFDCISEIGDFFISGRGGGGGAYGDYKNITKNGLVPKISPISWRFKIIAKRRRCLFSTIFYGNNFERCSSNKSRTEKTYLKGVRIWKQIFACFGFFIFIYSPQR